ncbi:CHAT domain-containing protein [Suillus plorans]|uniref:CHAT domain-containing protein n=1 Tax=Suillus plorans TaxID=116603 RepID=A0A9P7AC94_9AGAM|nr:CHAT domain-containing protein [Suillus plorans]KAG1785495.1 CHAT domain-containing protein [Suillus plorans]
MCVLFSEEPGYRERTMDPGETRRHSGVQRVVITAIRATGLTLGLRRIPAGFHAVVKAGGAEYQTSNKSVNIDQAVTEWDERILLPCEPCSKVRVSVYASFELGPMVCHGDLLRTFEISVGELLDRSEKSHPIILQPKQEEVVSACTSLYMAVVQQLSDQNDAGLICLLSNPTSRDMDGLALKTDAGHRLLARYRRTQNSRDLEQSIKHFERASDLCPVDHTCRPAALFNLATAKFVSCQAHRRYLDLDISISLFQDALDLRPTDHPDRSMTQLHLAIALLSRFAKRGFETDADAAEELLSEVLDVCHANSHVHRAALITIETCALDSAGSIDGNDLRQERPATSMLPFSPNQLLDRARRCLERDEPGALDEVISLHYDALRHYNTGHAYRGGLLCNLASMLQIRFERRSNVNDLNEAIALQREALALYPVGHTDRSKSLNNLATHLSSRFRHRGNDEDLNQAIALHREALALRPVGHTDRSMSLNNLANQLSIRFDQRGNNKDLDQAIALHREALALRPVGHADRSMSLHNLATRLSCRFDQRGNNKDLDQAIALHKEALTLRPVGHADRSMSLHNLATQLSSRFCHQGNDEDLDQAIVLHKEALALLPVGHTDRSGSLNNLAAQLSSRYDHRGNVEDLNQAIVFHREALALLLVGHKDRSKSLNNLATQLSSRFRHQGNDEDLDEAIALHREALALCPVGRTDRSMSLNNLANQLSSRFEQRGNVEDLDEAIALHREALDLYPVGHTDRSKSLNNLANQLSFRFDHRGNNEDLDQAIALQREALALLPVGHTDRFMSLNNLANLLSSRFRHRGNDEDLDQAITLHREVLALLPVGHTCWSMSLNNLANRLATRFERRGNREDLDESAENLRSALTLLTQHDPRQLMVHVSLAEVYLSFHHSGLDSTVAGENTDSLNAAMHYIKAAASVVSAGLLSRLRAGLRWVYHASEHSHGTQLEAYTTSMQLLDAYMSVTASVSSRHNAMKEISRTLAVDAASCVLRSGDVRRAVELLEQGRTIIWTQMARLRTPLDSLETCGDHAVTLMKRFRHLSSLLDNPPASDFENTPRVDVEAEATRYRRLVEDWNGTVEEIRKIEGFSRFLLPPLFSDLQDAGRDGPVIVLIASKSSCNAIIISHKQPPTSIQLHTNVSKLIELVFTFRDAVEKDAGPKGNQRALMEALRELWKVVVCPVVETLNEIVPLGSRIWWCPTSVFNFLPLHAAGEYRARGKSLSQQYISSYTPSLTALIKARAGHERSPSVPFVAIGQNHPAGALSILEAVEPELELVRTLLLPASTVSFSKITSDDATKSRALCALRDNTWLHLACHGIQRFDEPFQSAFLMRDQPLSLLDIAQMGLSRHQFAFLSACETAVGDLNTPDELIHLAAGLQFAGVKSVVGTLWKVNDSTVQRVVEAFYKNFCGDGTMNSKRAARALHRAVQSLASDKDIPLAQRIVFVHIGI